MVALTARTRRIPAMAWVLALMASTLFALSATPAQATTGCEPTADVPRYNSFTHWAEAGGYVRCGGYYEIKLVTSSGATLSKQSGNYLSPMQVYTNWVTCPSGTSVHSNVYEKANVQGHTYTYTVNSAPFLCP
jgi:hypothetical protein